MRTLVCFFFGFVWALLQFFGPQDNYAALIVSQVWLVGGMVSIGGRP